jgi:hypothetical protein
MVNQRRSDTVVREPTVSLKKRRRESCDTFQDLRTVPPPPRLRLRPYGGGSAGTRRAWTGTSLPAARERLLRELVLRGLDRDCLRPAALLVAALVEP